MSPPRRFFRLLVCVAVCGAAVFSLRNTLAAFQALPADNLLNDQRFAGQQQEAAVLGDTLVQLNRAIALRPEWPDYLHWRGRTLTLLYLNKSQSVGKPDATTRALLDGALENFRDVIRSKPLWSYGHLDLAYAKFLRGDIDDEFYGAFHQVYTEAKESYRVCHTLALMGLRLWPGLRAEYRDAVRDSFLVSYRKDRWAAMSMARDAGQTGIACLWARGEPKAHPLCDVSSAQWW